MLLIGKSDCFVHIVIIGDGGLNGIKNGQFAHCPFVYDPKTQAPYRTSAYPYSSDRSRHRPQQSSRSTNEEFSNGADGQWTEYLIELNRINNAVNEGSNSA